MRRLAVEHLIALGADMGDDPVELAAGIVAEHQPQVEAGGGGGRDDVARRRADVGAAQAGDAERGLMDQLGQSVAPPPSLRAEAELAPSAVRSGAGAAAIAACSAGDSGSTSS